MYINKGLVHGKGCLSTGMSFGESGVRGSERMACGTTCVSLRDDIQ